MTVGSYRGIAEFAPFEETMGSSKDGCGQIRQRQARPGKRWQESTISVAQWLRDSACGKNMGLL